MDDLISRQAAIDAVNKLVEWYKEKWHESRPTSESVIDVLNDLPSAQPERNKGRWIWWYEEEFTEHATEYTPHCKCSECGRECAPSVATSSNFCRNCGADMRTEGNDDN